MGMLDTSPFDDGEQINLSSGDVSPSKVCRGFYVETGGAGDVEFTTRDGTKLVLSAAENTYHPWLVRTFHQTNTTVATRTRIIAGF